MARRLPSLRALRAFEAGARHLSFTKAANELHVTQAAVSHQVRVLEEDLGVRLFHRLTRKLKLTRQGRSLLPVITQAFDDMADAANALRSENDSGRTTLSVTLTPSFSTRWLAPRLGRFWRRHPDIELHLHHSIALADFARDGVDIGVRAGSGTWPDLVSEFLMDVDVTPVCSPALLEGGNPIQTPADLNAHTLLHEDDYEEWVQWTRTAGIDDIVDARRGPIIDDSNALIEACAAGQGVALGRLSLIADDIERGRLAKLFDLNLELGYAYYIVYLRHALERPHVKAFRDFLLAVGAGEDARTLAASGSQLEA